MRKFFFTLFALTVAILIIRTNTETNPPPFKAVSAAKEETQPLPEEKFREIADVIKPGESFFDIFKDNALNFGELASINKATSGIYDLDRLAPGRSYTIRLDSDNRVQTLTYCIDDECFLCVRRTEEGFCAEKVPIQYKKETARISGVIKDNLVSSTEDLLLALELSDIFAWDIDFTTDLRDGDTFKIIVEELWLDGEFKKYGDILSAEFLNNRRLYRAYRFEHDGSADYYDSEGKSLRRAFLKAPLSYRRISSRFSKRRLHPILRIYRPHLGVDYAAPRGTPVSTVGDGTVAFAGYKGQNGRLVVIKHPNGYKTYYGHLSRIRKGIRKGAKVKQGQLIGYVGTTGLSTGPHLDYRIKKNGKNVNPLKLKLPSGKTLKGTVLAEFKGLQKQMASRLASVPAPQEKIKG